MSAMTPTRSTWGRCAILSIALATLTAHGSAAFATTQQKPAANRPSPQTTNVLFLCPHGAAKSVLASAYFQRSAKERGLDVRVDAAGIEPQEALSPVVVEHLRKNGYELPIIKPRAVTSQDVAGADVVVSMGCDLSGIPVGADKLRTWDDVPGPSEDLAQAEKVIRRRVVALVDELTNRSRK